MTGYLIAFDRHPASKRDGFAGLDQFIMQEQALIQDVLPDVHKTAAFYNLLRSISPW